MMNGNLSELWQVVQVSLVAMSTLLLMIALLQLYAKREQERIAQRDDQALPRRALKLSH